MAGHEQWRSNGGDGHWCNGIRGHRVQTRQDPRKGLHQKAGIVQSFMGTDNTEVYGGQ